MLQLKNIRKSYDSKVILDSISLDINDGEIVSILGPSGSGKTTLCKAMAGIVPFYMGGAYSGEVMVLGESTKGKKVCLLYTSPSPRDS